MNFSPKKIIGYVGNEAEKLFVNEYSSLLNIMSKAVVSLHQNVHSKKRWFGKMVMNTIHQKIGETSLFFHPT